MKIGVIGDYESICGFAALGLDIHPVEDTISAEKELERLASAEYGVIYITEMLAQKISKTIEQYKNVQTPAIIPIPTASGGFGVSRMRRFVEQAVGSDIIYNAH